MKVLILGNPERVKKYLPDLPVARQAEITVLLLNAPEDEVIAAGRDAEMVVVDAIAPFTADEIRHMPKLRLIQSEGVAYNGIDLAAAAERGILVCNQRGANAAAVAEHTVMLMLALLRSLVPGYQEVLAGRQIETKEYLMVHGICELSEKKVGLIGWGAIARATARLLVPFGPEIYYCRRSGEDPEAEETYGAHFLPKEELTAQCDIVSLHVPVTAETTGMCGDAFFRRMQEGSYLINTARGELVDNEALCRALASGKLLGAGLDTLAPEPVQKDNPVLQLPEDVRRRVIVTPHIAGVTSGFFRRAHRTIWENAERIERGQEPVNLVALPASHRAH